MLNDAPDEVGRQFLRRRQTLDWTPPFTLN
jgi:hypothetical protein